MQDQIKLVGKRSTALTIPQDLTTRCNILVSEVFDTELIGEGALGVFIHAHEHLLTTDVITVPYAATVYVQVIQSDFLAQHNHLADNLGLSVPSEWRDCPGMRSLEEESVKSWSCPIDWLIDWIVYWLIDWLIDWIVYWLIDWLIDFDVDFCLRFQLMILFCVSFTQAPPPSTIYSWVNYIPVKIFADYRKSNPFSTFASPSGKDSNSRTPKRSKWLRERPDGAMRCSCGGTWRWTRRVNASWLAPRIGRKLGRPTRRQLMPPTWFGLFRTDCRGGTIGCRPSITSHRSSKSTPAMRSHFMPCMMSTASTSASRTTRQWIPTIWSIWCVRVTRISSWIVLGWPCSVTLRVWSSGLGHYRRWTRNRSKWWLFVRLIDWLIDHQIFIISSTWSIDWSPFTGWIGLHIFSSSIFYAQMASPHLNLLYIGAPSNLPILAAKQTWKNVFVIESDHLAAQILRTWLKTTEGEGRVTVIEKLTDLVTDIDFDDEKVPSFSPRKVFSSDCFLAEILALNVYGFLYVDWCDRVRAVLYVWPLAVAAHVNTPVLRGASTAAFVAEFQDGPLGGAYQRLPDGVWWFVEDSGPGRLGGGHQVE